MAKLTSIADVRKNHKALSSSFVSSVNSKLQRKKGGDPRFWQPTYKDDKAKAIIRFLPAAPGEEDAIVCVKKHWFKGENGVYDETSRLTLSENEPDPAQEHGWKVFGIGTTQAKEQGKQFLARERYICNIYVIKDDNAPENEGQVFLYDMPKTIAEMINDAGAGDADAGDEPKVVVGFWEAHNFIVDVFKENVGNNRKYPKYTRCKFSNNPTDLLADGSDKEYEKLWKKQYKLEEFVDPANIKSYADLKARLKEVLGSSSSSDEADEPDETEEEETTRPARREGRGLQSKNTTRSRARDDEEEEETKSSDDDESPFKSDSDENEEEEEESYYSRLAKRRGGK